MSVLSNEQTYTERVKDQRNSSILDIPGGEKIHHSITINRSPEEIYAFWRDFKNLPLFMKDLSEVQVLSAALSHWVVELESGPKVEWDAEIIAERAGAMIAWQSLKGSEIETSGAVVFEKAPPGRGTVVRLVMDHALPGGIMTELATRVLGEDPDTLVQINLKRLKALLETGEVPTTEGQPSGRDENSYALETH